MLASKGTSTSVNIYYKIPFESKIVEKKTLKPITITIKLLNKLNVEIKNLLLWKEYNKKYIYFNYEFLSISHIVFHFKMIKPHSCLNCNELYRKWTKRVWI